MAQPWAKSFYKSGPWRNCRDGYIRERRRIDGGVCEVCRENMGYIVHHKILLTPENINDPEVSLNWRNLSYECKACHDRHEGHGVGVSSEIVCEFDNNGDPIAIKPEFAHDRL